MLPARGTPVPAATSVSRTRFVGGKRPFFAGKRKGRRGFQPRIPGRCPHSCGHVLSLIFIDQCSMLDDWDRRRWFFHAPSPERKDHRRENC